VPVSDWNWSICAASELSWVLARLYSARCLFWMTLPAITAAIAAISMITTTNLE
jgi:hypothetical protein